MNYGFYMIEMTIVYGKIIKAPRFRELRFPEEKILV